jgi:uncharacterized protein YoxC|tara:strand:+ start:228 stop:644 length:417 start_codon:yes stop_codon:yes gene_type:complete
MELPKVNILTAGTMVIATVGTISGAIWYASSQASIIEGLTEQVETLTIENNATDRTNLIRDVQQNSEQLDEMIDILAEIYEDIEDGDNEIWEDIDQIHEDVGGMASHMMAIVKLQSRVKTLESTLEFLARRPTMSDGR